RGVDGQIPFLGKRMPVSRKTITSASKECCGMCRTSRQNLANFALSPGRGGAWECRWVRNGQGESSQRPSRTGGQAMHWLSLGTDALLAGLGIWLLLIGYGVIGKRNGDAAQNV